MGTKVPESYGTLGRILGSQREYNEIVREDQGNKDPEFWTKQYLLGLVSEVDEVLREINWKLHVSGRSSINMHNLGMEITDLMKYVLSIYEVWGFDEEDIALLMTEKNAVLEAKWGMDKRELPQNSKVLICDLDGTIADWRSSFLQDSGFDSFEALSLLAEVDMGIKFPEYSTIKQNWEENGGYRNMLPYFDGTSIVRDLQKEGVKVCIFTARPYAAIHRVWNDTYTWLRERGIDPDWLFMGSEDRILWAGKLPKTNDVIFFEDDPALALREANSGFKVYLRDAQYNKYVDHQNIIRINRFSQSTTYFGG